MTLLIYQDNVSLHRDVLEKAYRFRHSFFVDHMGWEQLRQPDEREIDEFDCDECLHIVETRDDRVAAYSRLLPTTRPHLLSSVYPEILAGAVAPTGPDIWEWTRYAVAPAAADHSDTDPSTRRLLLGLLEGCLFVGIRGLVMETHPFLLSRSVALGWDTRPLALPTLYDGKPVVPIYAAIDHRTLDVTRRVFGIGDQVLDPLCLPRGHASRDRRAA